ncbi:hypothetical protein DICPUDRAFT_18799, partial [Dictyostelium purpureum]
RCRNSKVYLNSKKCQFFCIEVEFLGHVISAEGIKVRDSKIAAIQEYPIPATIGEVRSFLGLCNYYRRFIPSYTELTAGLTSITSGKNYTKLKLSDKIIDDIEKLKLALASSKLLIKPDPKKTFHVYIDASDVGTGCMITQFDSDNNERPVLYDSKKFNSFQKSYTTTDRELLALINVLKKFDYLLLGNKFIVYSDHLNLAHYQTKQETPKRLIRWLDLISMFSYELVHIEGKKNIAADFLSRNAKFYYDWDDGFLDQVKESYEVADEYSKKWLETAKLRNDMLEKDGLLYLIDATTDSRRLVLVDKAQITKILDEGHLSNYAGHPGVYRLTARIRPSFYFPKFWKRVKAYVAACPECQKVRIEREKHGLLNPLPIPARPWNDVTMDFLSLP